MLPSRRNGKKGSGNPENRTEIALLVDTVRSKDRCIVKVIFPDTDPAQLVTDSFDLF
jgi:hypothetical protein